MSSSEESRTASRFDLLDGVRGIAAFTVMVYHYTEPNGLHWFGGAWIAVDLFFILSGFVIAHGFGGKVVAGMEFRRFLFLRLLRLAPLYYVGLVLGVIANLLPKISAGLKIGLTPVLKAFAFGALWLPYFNDTSWPFGPEVLSGSLFPLNNPAWSLFFELIANIAFFFFVKWSGRLSSARLVSVAAGIFLFLTFHFHEFNPGWAEWNFGAGFPRAIAEFFLGALFCEAGVHRAAPSARIALGLGVVAIVLSLSRSVNLAFVNALVIAPLLIVSLSRISVSGVLKSVCTGLGELSYPLYIVHFPIYRIVFDLFDLERLGHPTQVVLIASLSLGVAAVLARGDQRFRRHVQRRWAQ